MADLPQGIYLLSIGKKIPIILKLKQKLHPELKAGVALTGEHQRGSVRFYLTGYG
jgi:hypothetical protein